MVTRNLLTASILAIAMFLTASAKAEEPTTGELLAGSKTPAPAPAVPAVHHAPRMTAQVGEDLTIGASIDRADEIKRTLLVYQGPEGKGEIEFQRSSGELPYVATIPGAAVRGPMLSYAIELETTDGGRVAAFASRANPHPVTVLDAANDVREATALARLGGRRSVIQAGGEYVDFGRSSGQVFVPGLGIENRSVRDAYYRFEGSYTYRLLGVVSEFGIRAGVVRGRSLVKDEPDPTKYDVGLNYGAPRLRLRLSDWFHVEGELLISVTEVGFSTGGGGAVLLGDPYGTKLVFGGEGISVFGGRGYTRLDIVASKRLALAPTIEVSTMPHADVAGVRLLGDVNIDVGAGFKVNLRGGYQARSFERGGPTAGGGLAYAF
jgi:hypothetical protein